MTWDWTQALAKTVFRDLLICVGVALAFSFLGVYDSDNMAWPIRVMFWTTIMCMGGLVIAVFEPLIFGRILKNQPPFTQIFAVATVISIPITIFLVGLNTQFKFGWPLIDWATQYAGVIVISLIIVIGRYLASRIFNRPIYMASDKTVSGIDKFLERLPIKFRTTELYAVSSEGHYLRAHTEKGSTLILMRVSDAVRELEGADGLQVHRSWWVSRNGIADTQKIKGRRMLILKSGEVVPVSRSFLPALKAANLDK